MPSDGSTNKKRDYEVGRGKPPAHTRFQKGKSGNPRGRPKGKVTRIDFDEALDQVLSTLVPVNENGRQRKITVLRAMFKQTALKSLKGHHASTSLLMQMATRTARTGSDHQVATQSDAQSRKEFESFMREIADNLDTTSGNETQKDNGSNDSLEEKSSQQRAKDEPPPDQET